MDTQMETPSIIYGNVQSAVRKSGVMTFAAMGRGKRNRRMTNEEIIKKAINYAISDLCEGYLDMPIGCEGCPLWDPDHLDEDGNARCREDVFERFMGKYNEEVRGNVG